MHGLEFVILVIATVWAIAIAFGWSSSRGNWLILIGGSTLVYLVSFGAWWYVLSLDVVWYDLLNLERLDKVRTAWLYIAPPFVAVVAFALLFRRGYVV